ncbi:MAG TPA: helix-hairpin-helix domain-containing protein [Chitinophagaceae bacterium]|nr:helix-hairpin-helix domain-containing protein [Chitinophagaceae bacterium]HQV84290.1 helix-hairpin-helix domain-containing protein [Chitinophagaceae bacterium]HQX71618.1 helix-hairpin-helix domain-containing protein [Chitinophagaceae bacterium]HQZ75376.1 helix-hairpin-helix domain-containing protein [Chitinophagaceae bacterium]
MDNAAIADNFALLAKLMDIHGENPFKSKTYAVAAFNIEKLPVSLQETPREKLFSIKGIGESVGRKVIEMLDTGRLEILDEIISKTPTGVIEMLNIKGLGPKKINTIWKEMGIESIGELLYACNENRLTLFKGFGEKTQKNVQESIEFYFQHQGHFLYAQLDEVFPQIDNYLKKIFSPEKVHVTGRYRRQELTIDELEFVILEQNETIKPKFQTAQPPELVEETASSLLFKLRNGLKLRLYTGGNSMPEELFKSTGSPEFLEAFRKAYPSLKYSSEENGNDEAVFRAVALPYILPCLRESAIIIEKAKQDKLPELIQVADIRSIIHSHSNWSDGSNTIEEMATESIKRGYEYLVISDHSQTAFYANGLKEDRIREQQRYIDELNTKLAPFRIFKSIESDILNDGSLDYPDHILKTFDLVIASVHSNLGMPEEKANARLIKAIENPYTTILGHMTGRLLLSRSGYPVDHKKIIDACVNNQVVIELNAHPRRLDIDWKWIEYALEKGVLLSIDPDAHALDGFDDVKYGVLAAQKGGLTKQKNLSSFSLREFEEFLRHQKEK